MNFVRCQNHPEIALKTTKKNLAAPLASNSYISCIPKANMLNIISITNLLFVAG